MIVGEKMSAIANLIRTILGTTEKMGVDAIATNLESILTGLENAYTAVGSKNGTIPEQKTIGNLANAIGTVNAGVHVQKKSGWFTTNNKGNATVNCGFLPDMVFFTVNESKQGYLYNCAAAFAECNSNSIDLSMWTTHAYFALFDIMVTRTASGFSITACTRTEALEKNYSELTFNYIAVKYT